MKPEVDIERWGDAWDIRVFEEGRHRDFVRILFHDDGRTEIQRITWKELCRVAWEVVDGMAKLGPDRTEYRKQNN